LSYAFILNKSNNDWKNCWKLLKNSQKLCNIKRFFVPLSQIKQGLRENCLENCSKLVKNCWNYFLPRVLSSTFCQRNFVQNNSNSDQKLYFKFNVCSCICLTYKPFWCKNSSKLIQNCSLFSFCSVFSPHHLVKKILSCVTLVFT